MNLYELFKTMCFNIRSLRLYWLNVLTTSLLIPLSYLIIVILLSPDSPNHIIMALTGFIVISEFSTLVLPVALLVGGIFDENVVELYASLPTGFSEIILSYVLTYLVFSIPVLFGFLLVISKYTAMVNWPYLLIGLVYLLTLCSLIGIWLGLYIKNRLILEPLLSLMLIAVIVFTPAYYRLTNVSGPLRLITLVNPVTHVVNLLRTGVNMCEGIETSFSILYLTLIVMVISISIVLRLNRGLTNFLEVK
ncbi:MAG: ABC transporter permease [Desulfurococcaceae archaeon]